MPKRHFISCLFVLGHAILFFVLGGQFAQSGETTPIGDGVVVRDHRLFRFDKPFIARGYIFQAFTEVAEQLRACRQKYEYCRRHLDAQDFYFGRGRFAAGSGLDLARAWGADTIRLNVNQAALDPESKTHSSSYERAIEAAVGCARRMGFVVVLALFDERNVNAPSQLFPNNPKTPLDTATTERAAVALAKIFGNDRGVMLELLNEPWSPGRLEDGWRWWRDGGEPNYGRYAGAKFVGVNREIAAMRAVGAKNVVIVQGLLMSFEGFPGGVKDPLTQVAYSVHPFFLDGRARDLDWDEKFGNLSKSQPVLITAWGTSMSEHWCERRGMSLPAYFLKYLQLRSIGLIVYALDVPWTMDRDFRQRKIIPTRYPIRCANWGGPGELVRRYFATGVVELKP